MNFKEIKTYQDVCKAKGIDPVASLPFPNPKAGEDDEVSEEEAINSFTKIIRTIEVLNDGWKPNWQDSEERKYYPWFDMDPEVEESAAVGSGVGFSFFDCYYVLSASFVGSRLVLKSRELVEHLQEHFLDDYRGFMVIGK